MHIIDWPSSAGQQCTIRRKSQKLEVNSPRQSRGMVSRSKRLKTQLAWLLASAGPVVASGNTGGYADSLLNPLSETFGRPVGHEQRHRPLLDLEEGLSKLSP